MASSDPHESVGKTGRSISLSGAAFQGEDAAEMDEDDTELKAEDKLSRLQSSAEKNYWSRRHKLWQEFTVERPRVPTRADDPSKAPLWHRKNYPANFQGMKGSQNDETIAALREIAQDGVMKNLVIHGPAGSGKSAVTHAFLTKWKEVVDAERLRGIESGELTTMLRKLSGRKNLVIRRRTLPHPVLEIDWQEAQNMSTTEKKVSAWLDELNKYLEIQQRVIVLDGLCRLTPNHQQWFSRLMDKYEMTGEPARPVFFLFTAVNQKRVINKLRMRARFLPVSPLETLPSLKLFLSIVCAERVGFEREGLEVVYKQVGPHVGSMLDVVQTIFSKYHFLSYINVCKELGTEVLQRWKASGLQFFEFHLLDDAYEFTNPWTGTISKVRHLGVEGHISTATYLVRFHKRGADMEHARAALKRTVKEMRAAVKKAEADGLVESLLNTKRDGEESSTTRRRTLKDKPLGDSKAEIAPKMRKVPRVVTKANLEATIALVRTQHEVVEEPYLMVRNVSDHSEQHRVDFVLKKAGSNEWVFLEFLVLDALLFDPDSRISALEAILVERPLIRLEDLMEKMHGQTKRLPMDARLRDARRNGRFIDSPRLESIDLSRAKQNFQVQGNPRSGLQRDPRHRGGGFDATRTRWYRRGLHEYFDGRQCWRVLVKGQPVWTDFGNVKEKESHKRRY